MDYESFLDSGWSFNEQDKRIVERWKQSGRSGVPTLRTINHIRWRLMFEGDRFTNVDSATQEWFPEVIAEWTLPTRQKQVLVTTMSCVYFVTQPMPGTVGADG